MFASAQEALKYIAEKEIVMIDLKIVGLKGQWMHITIPASSFSMKHFEEGVGYDGSSGSGFSSVEHGDLAALPLPETAFVDPFWDVPTLSFLCVTVTADTREEVGSDPRTIALKAVDYMRESGIADTFAVGPEFEFYVFDRVETIYEPYYMSVQIVSSETDNEGSSPRIQKQKGYFEVPPTEQLHNIRSEISVELEKMGIAVRYHHHEVGAPGQCEIEVDLCPFLRAADQTMMIKYVTKNVARRHSKVATFMPKPVFGEAGTGMHVHQKLDKDGKPLFFDEQRKNYANLSDLALHYVAGLLKHGRALTALTNPSTNSFKRLRVGYEAPTNLFFSLANRSAAIRVPKYAVSPEDKRIEYRPPDFTCNVYLALAGMLMAGLDGIKNQIELESNNFGPFDVDIAKQDEEFREKITPVPNSLYNAAQALKRDFDFLTEGDVFTESFVRNWIDIKKREEREEVAIHPHPFEYRLYLDT